MFRSVLSRCKTQAGVGSKLLWIVRLEGQSSSIVNEDGSPMPTTSYLPPIITSLASLDTSINPAVGYLTDGGVRMLVRGRSFGPPGTDVRLLFGSGWDTCISNKTSCLT